MKFLSALAPFIILLALGDAKEKKGQKKNLSQDTPIHELNATQLECIPPDIKCNMPGRVNGLNGFKPFAKAVRVKMPSICYELCNHEDHRERCVAFAHTRRERRCVFYEFPVADGAVEQRLTGTRFWDAACWACGVSRDPPW